MLSRLLTSVLVVVALTIFSTTSEAARIAEQLLSVGRDQHRTEPQLQIQAKNPGLQSTVAKAADTTAFTTVTDESDGSSAGIQIVARQTLFDYGVQQALDVLTDRVTHLQIPDASK